MMKKGKKTPHMANGVNGSSMRDDIPFKHTPLAYSLALLLGTGHTLTANAAPTGGVIAGGEGGIAYGTKTTVTQSSASLAIDWQSFNVGTNESVNFVQPSSSSVVLNRILDQNPSQIYGSINANGRVFLSNPNGIVFGENAAINVGSFVASGLDITAADFMADNYNFGTADIDGGSVINRGLINAASGGSVTLIGSSVSNEGVIVADYGTVNLGAARTAVLDFDGDGLINFAIDGAVLDNALGVSSSVDNQGEIHALGGEVLLSAEAARDVFSHVINNDGLIEAGRIEDRGGVVRLVGVGDGEVISSGRIDVSGQDEYSTGGTVRILGEKVGLLDSAEVNASGPAGGGTILIGGDRQGENPEIRNADITFVGEDTTVRADATVNGNGGEVIVYAADTARIYGLLSARGGIDGGDGGFIETSGKQYLAISSAPDVGAPQGSGGEWLIDPYDLTITDGCASECITEGPLFTFTSGNGTTYLDVGLILTALTKATSGTIVTVEAGTGGGLTAGAGDITLNTDLDYDGIGAGKKLTLSAQNDIVLNGAVYDSDTSTTPDDGLSLTLSTSQGSITNGLNVPTITVDSLSMNAYSAIGSDTSVINAVASAIDATAGTDIYLSNVGDVNFAATTSSGSVNFQNEGDITVASVGLVNGVTAGGSGDVSVSTINSGNVTLNGNIAASGDAVTLESVGSITGGGTVTASSVDLQAGSNIGTSSGGINTATAALHAQSNATTADTGDIYINNTGAVTFDASTSAGSISLTNTSGDLTVGASGITTNGTGDIVLTTNTNNNGDIVYNGNLTALGASVTLTAADAISGDQTKTISADTVTLSAVDGIGAGTDSALQLNAATISATNSGTGDIQLTNTGDTTFTSVTADAGTITISNTGAATFTSVEASGNIAISNSAGTVAFDGVTTTTNGSISLSNDGGDLTVNDSSEIRASGSNKNVEITTTTAGDININGNVTAPGDAVTINSVDAIVGSTTGRITSDTIILTAENGIGTAGTPLLVKATADGLSATNTVDGGIYLSHEGNVTLLSDRLVNTDRDVSLETTSGNITIGNSLDYGAGTLSLNAGGYIHQTNSGDEIKAGSIDLDAVDGIGASSQSIVLDTTEISADNSGTGGVYVDNTSTLATTVTSLSSGTTSESGDIEFNQIGNGTDVGSVDFESVTTADGDVDLTSAGDMTIVTNVTASGTSKDISLTTTSSSAADIIVSGTVAASDIVTIASDGSISGTGVITASTADLDANTGITAYTNAATLEADNAGSGDIYVSSSANVTVAGLSNGERNITLASTGGSDINLNTDVNIGAAKFTVDSSGNFTNGTSASITAAQVELNAVTGIGTSSAYINLISPEITAVNTSSGGVYLTNDTTDSTVVNIEHSGTGDVKFQQNGGGEVTFDTVTASNGVVDLRSTGSNLTVETAVSAGSGKGVTLTTTTSGNIFLNGTTSVDTDTVSMAQVTVNSIDAIQSSSSGTITAYTADLDAQNGIVATTNVAKLYAKNLSDNAIEITNTGNDVNVVGLANGSRNISLSSTTDNGNGNINLGVAVDLGTATSGGTFSVDSAGNFTNSSGSNSITAASVNLAATTGIGTSTTPIRLISSAISAENSGTGNIYIANATSATVTVSSLTTDNGLIDFDQTGNGDVGFGNVSTTTGDIWLSNSAGDLVVADSGAIIGGGDVYLTTTTSSKNVILSGTTTADGNTVTISSQDQVYGGGLVSAGTVNISSVNGIGVEGSTLEALSLSTGNLIATNTRYNGIYINNDSSSGSATNINLRTGTYTDGVSPLNHTGSIAYTQTGGDAVNVGVLSTDKWGNSNNQITLTNSDGIITGSGVITTDSLIVSSSGGSTLDGANKVDTLNVTSSGTGDVYFNNAASVTITGMTTDAGDIDVVVSSGNMTLSGDISAGSDGDVSLSAKNAIAQSSGGITANLLTTSSVHATTLTSDTNAVSQFNAANTGTGAITLKNTQSLVVTGISQSESTADVSITNTGDIQINGSIDSDVVSLEADGGKIIDATGDDTLVDISASSLFVLSSTGVGVSDTDALNLSVGNLSIESSGNVYITNDTSLNIGSINVGSNDLFIGTTGRDIGLGAASVSGINISNTELAAITASSLYLSTDGKIQVTSVGEAYAGDLVVSLTSSGASDATANTISFSGNNTFNGLSAYADGKISVGNTLITKGADLVLEGSQIDFGSTFSTSLLQSGLGLRLAASDPSGIVIKSDTTFDTAANNGSIDLGDIAITSGGGSGTNLKLELISGSGDITIGTVGSASVNTEKLKSVTTDTTGTVYLKGDIYTNQVDGINFADSGQIVLKNDVLLNTATGNGAVDLGNPLYSASIPSGPFSLTVVAGTGTVTLGEVGQESTAPMALVEGWGELRSLTVDSGGLTTVSGPIAATGTVDFSNADNVELLGDVSLSSATGDVWLGSNTSGSYLLSIDAAVDSAIGAANVGSVVVSSGGDTTLGGNLTTTNGIDFTNANGAVLNTDVTLTGGDGEVILNGLIDGTGKTFSVSAASAGAVLAGDVVINAESVYFSSTTISGNNSLVIDTEGAAGTVALAGIDGLNSLLVSNSGTTTLAGNITTENQVDLSAATNIQLLSDLAIDTTTGNGYVDLGGASVNGARALVITANSGEVNLGDFGQTTALKSLQVVTTGTTTLNGSISTQGTGIDLSQASTVYVADTAGTPFVLDSTISDGAILLNGGTLDGAGGLTIYIGDNGSVDFSEVGTVIPLESLTVIGAGSTNFTNSVATTYDLDLSSASDVNLTGDVTFESLQGNVDISGGDLQSSGSMVVASSGVTYLGGNYNIGADLDMSSALNTQLVSDTFIDNSLGTGMLVLTGDIDGAYLLDINAGSGGVSFGNIGQSDALTSLSTDSLGAVVMNGDITVGNDLAVNGSSVTMDALSLVETNTGDVSYTATSGNILLGEISAVSGSVALKSSGGDILNNRDTSDPSVISLNVTSNTLSLDAQNRIGVSATDPITIDVPSRITLSFGADTAYIRNLRGTAVTVLRGETVLDVFQSSRIAANQSTAVGQSDESENASEEESSEAEEKETQIVTWLDNTRSPDVPRMIRTTKGWLFTRANEYVMPVVPVTPRATPATPARKKAKTSWSKEKFKY